MVVGLRLKAGHGEAGLEPAPERYRGGPTLSRRRGRLSGDSPCRYSGRAICRYYVSYGLPLSTCLQGAEGWRGSLFLLAKSVTARSERKLVRLIGLGESFGMGPGNTEVRGAAVRQPA